MQALKNSPLELAVCGSVLLSQFCELFVCCFVRVCFVVVTMFWSDAVLATWSQNNTGAGSHVSWGSGWQVDFKDLQEAEKETSLPFQHLEDS